MTPEELTKEAQELYVYLQMTKITEMYDAFNWNGLDYWDADRRHHEITRSILTKNLMNVIIQNKNI